MNEQRKCLNCGNVIPINLRSDAKYCSQDCRVEFNSTLKSKKRRKEKQNVSVKFTAKKKGVGSADDVYYILKEVNDKLSKVISLMELNERVLTPAQVMQELSIKRSTFDRYVKDGRLKVYKLTDRKLYCKWSDILSLFT